MIFFFKIFLCKWDRWKINCLNICSWRSRGCKQCIIIWDMINKRKSHCVSRWMEILLSWKLIMLKKLNVSIQNSYCHLHGKELQEMKDSLIHNTHKQDPEPILAKVIKNLKPLAQQKESHDVINEKEMDGESGMSFHLLSSSSLSNTEMERHLVQRKRGSDGITARRFENHCIFEIIWIGRYLWYSFFNIVVCIWDRWKRKMIFN